MTYNYHTHTFRCHHATGTEEEYIEKAIAGGLQHMGFSDHIPMRFPDGTESPHRIPTREAALYVQTIARLQETYKGRLTIHCGFEMEYYPAFFEQMRDKAVEYGAEYLILGQHFLQPEYLPNTKLCLSATSSVEDLHTYVSLVTEGIKTGVFTYVAHPDILTFTGDAAVYREEMRKLCATAKEYDTPLEINFLGIRTNRFYPHEEFWAVAGEMHVPVVFGFDAHDADAAYDGASLSEAMRLVETYRLPLLETVSLKPIR